MTTLRDPSTLDLKRVKTSPPENPPTILFSDRDNAGNQNDSFFGTQKKKRLTSIKNKEQYRIDAIGRLSNVVTDNRLFENKSVIYLHLIVIRVCYLEVFTF